ncbi:MAG: histidine kinase, partial [Bacteroidota bacterium]
MSKLYFAWLLCFSTCLIAQSPHPQFRNYTTDHGLPSPEVHSCMQDTAGYMWFATDNGISRFDGYSFTNFGPREGLLHPVVFYIQQDTTGRLWLGTMQGRLYYIEGDSILPFSGNTQIAQINPNNRQLNDFYIDKQNNKYLSILHHGILQFSPNGVLQTIRPQEHQCHSFSIPIDDIWMTGSFGIRHHKLTSDWPALAPRSTISLSKNNIPLHHLKIEFEGRTFCNSGNTIVQLPNDRILGYQVSPGTLFERTSKGIAWHRPFPYKFDRKSVYVAKNTGILVGTQQKGGLRQFADIEALKKGAFKQLLPDVSITHIYQTPQGAFWISTLENGVYYTAQLDHKIYDQTSGFPHGHITALDFQSAHELFIGFRNGTLLQFNALTNQITYLPDLPNQGEQLIYDVLFDQQRQELWVTNSRLQHYDFQQWYYTDFEDNYLIGKRLSLSRTNELLWGTNSVGFGKIRLADKLVYPQPPSSTWHRTLRIWEDYQGRIWVGNINGLFEYKNEQLIPPNFTHPAFNTRVEDIAELSDSTLVIATKGQGLLLWKDSYFKQLTTEKGLSSNMLENVHVDEKDQIWVGTLEGLNRILRKGTNIDIEVYTMAHGLPSNEITRVNSYAGQVWVATTRGLLKWQDFPRSTKTHRPLLEQVLVNQQVIQLSPNPHFSSTENNLSFEFVSINYQQNGKIPYRYRLNQSNWLYTNNRIVNYAQLAPDQYTFEVQAQNQNGIWSPSQSFSFTIRPAFWQTWWFISSIFIALIGLVYWAYRNRLQRVQQRTATEREMTQLQQAALRAQMNPHFIFNCLNSIQHFIAKNDQTNAMRYLAKFSQLVRGVLNASMAEQISLEEEINILDTYLILEKLRFKDKFNYHIHVDASINRFERTIPPLLTQPFVENAIKHGFANIQQDGLLEILFSLQEKQLQIIIRDNGVGLQNAQKRSIPRAHKGVGMSISQ